MSSESTLPVSKPHGPLGPIAVSLSGGGYRAAAFHLGTLRFLHDVGLLSDVVGLSTVSGGTLTGLAWVVSQIDGKPFPVFHDAWSAYLKRTNVIAEALDELTSSREPISHNWASLIRSAADVYSRPDLFGERRFDEVLGASNLQLQEAIFNATEFHTALDFRFRRSNNPGALLGNINYKLPRSVAQHVRLADIAAASSCFPGGFEPLVFPQQFHWTQDYPLSAALAELGPGFNGGLPLMDGGIYDNQGVDSLVLAFGETPNPPTLLISDVSTQDDEMYNVPENPMRRGWLTLDGVSWLGWGLFLLTLVCAGVLSWCGIEEVRAGTWAPSDFFLYLIPGLLTASVAAALVWVHRRLTDVRALIQKQVDMKAWPSILKLTVAELTQMLVLRGTSLLALTSSVFMKRVRGLIYSRVYETPAFKDRRMSNLIYGLTVNRPKLFSEHPWLQPGPHLVALAQQACQMPTTLWFTEESQFNNLESAGQATVCFTLLRHIIEHRKGQYESPDKPLHALFQKLRQAWDGFNQAPRQPEAARTVAAA